MIFIWSFLFCSDHKQVNIISWICSSVLMAECWTGVHIWYSQHAHIHCLIVYSLSSKYFSIVIRIYFFNIKAVIFTETFCSCKCMACFCRKLSDNMFYNYTPLITYNYGMSICFCCPLIVSLMIPAFQKTPKQIQQFAL